MSLTNFVRKSEERLTATYDSVLDRVDSVVYKMLDLATKRYQKPKTEETVTESHGMDWATRMAVDDGIYENAYYTPGGNFH
jgi:hypothetical protein